MKKLGICNKIQESLYYIIFCWFVLCVHLFYYIAYQKQLTNFDMRELIPYCVGSLFVSIFIGGILHKILTNKYIMRLFIIIFGERNKTTYSVKYEVYFLICSFCGFFILLLPFFLIFFPGILAYDFLMQMNEIETMQFTNHHPIVHTLLLKLFYTIGINVFNNGTIGIAFYTIFQMLILVGAFTYTIFSLYKISASYRIIIIQSIYFMLFPPVLFMAISTTKDVIFSAFVLIFIVSLMNYLYINKKSRFFQYNIIFFIVSAFYLILFRNNGKYALFSCIFVIMCIAFGYREVKKFKNITILLILVMIIAFFIQGIVERNYDVKPADDREMFSIPIQQLLELMCIIKILWI